MWHRVEFDIWRPGVGVSTRLAADVDAESGDDAAAKGLNEAHRVAAGGGYKVLAVYPVAEGEPLRAGLEWATAPMPVVDVGVEPDGVAEKPDAPQTEESERDMLRETLAGLGVHFDKRWGVERLKQALAEAGA